MTWYQMAGDWEKFTVMVKERWVRLTDDDLKTFGGGSSQLSSMLQQKYGYTRDEAEQEIEDFSSPSKT